MASTVIGPYNAGELPPPLVVTFKDSSGTPIDFSSGGPWSAKFIYRPYGGAAVTRSCAVPSLGDGKVTYTWVLADFTTAGDFEAECWVGNAAGGNNRRFDSIRFAYQVKPSVAIPVI